MKKSNLFCRLSVGFHPSSSSSSSGECHQSVCSRPRCRPDISYQDILYQIFCFQDIPRQMTDILSSRYLTPITLILIISRYPMPDILSRYPIPDIFFCSKYPTPDILSSRYPTPDICFDHIVSYPAFS